MRDPDTTQHQPPAGDHGGNDAAGPTGPGDTTGPGETAEPPPPPGSVLVFVRRLCLIAVLPAFSAFYLWQAMTIALPDRALIVSPRGFPTLLGVLMLAVTGTISLLEIHKLHRAARARAAGKEAPDELDDDTDQITSWKDAWVTLGALVAYVLLFPVLGFLLATVLFLGGLSIFFAPRSWLRNAIVAVLFTGAIHLLFTEMLGVSLPAGVLEGML